MEANRKNEKIKTALAGVLVLTLAIIFSAFRSHDETVADLSMDESAFEISMEWADVMSEELVEIEEQVFKTAKIYDRNNELVEMVVMLEHESLNEIYTGEVFNQAEFLAEVGTVSIYRISD